MRILDREVEIFVVVLKVGLKIRSSAHGGPVKDWKVPRVSVLNSSLYIFLGVGLGALSYLEILKPFAEARGSSRKSTASRFLFSPSVLTPVPGAGH